MTAGLRRRAALAAAALLLAGAGAGCAGPARPVCSGPRVDARHAEQRAHALVARHRQRLGLSRLEGNAALADLARSHSRQMAAAGRLSHQGFRERGREAGSRLGTRAAAENVGLACGSAAAAAETVFRRWLGSSGHRRNLEGPYRFTGVGAFQDPSGQLFFTQLFAGP